MRNEARRLRGEGKSYGQIAEKLEKSRSTIWTWCSDVALTKSARKTLDLHKSDILVRARANAIASRFRQRQERMDNAKARVSHLKNTLYTRKVGKLIVGALYLAEGSKGNRSCLTFGNSDPGIVRLFLELLRQNFSLEEKRFRCTLQGRHGQDYEQLQQYWSTVTRIPRRQFYAPRIDPRTVGSQMNKPDYKGVCRIDYLSKDLLYEVQAIGSIMTENKGL